MMIVVDKKQLIVEYNFKALNLFNVFFKSRETFTGLRETNLLILVRIAK